MIKSTNTFQKKWEKEEKEKCIRLRKEGLSMREIAERVNRSKSSVSNFLWAYNQTNTPVERGKPASSNTFCGCEPTIEKEKQPTKTVVGEDMVAEACTKDIKTLEQLIEICEIDLDKWQIERWTANTWQVGTKIGERVVKTNLYQIKAFLKLKPITIEDIKSLFSLNLPKQKTIPPLRKRKSGAKKLLEISIPDIHLGKLCWREETGENYDTSIAIKKFKDAIDDLLTRVPADDVSTILLPLGNDLLNVDNKKNETSNGTPQSEDGRWQKSFKKACELTSWAIKRCLEVAPVKVPIVPGNHDTERSFYLGCFLEALFDKNDDVEINNAPTERKYCRFGNTLLGFTHGDRIKLKELINLAQVEQRKAWGETKYCEWHLGHLHRESSIEDGGVIARVIPSLCPPDAYHYKHGYVMNVPASQAFVYDGEKGIESIYYHRP